MKRSNIDAMICKQEGITAVSYTHLDVYKRQDHMISLCVHEQPAYCVAACPFKMDTKAVSYTHLTPNREASGIVRHASQDEAAGKSNQIR